MKLDSGLTLFKSPKICPGSVCGPPTPRDRVIFSSGIEPNSETWPNTTGGAGGRTTVEVAAGFVAGVTDASGRNKGMTA
jgi:hypothetical protein